MLTDPRTMTLKQLCLRIRVLDMFYLRADRMWSLFRDTGDKVFQRAAEKASRRYRKLVDDYRNNNPEEWAKFQGTGI